MNKDLLNEFLKNRSTSEDKSIYDEKHRKIIENVDLYGDISKLRNWDLQNDMGLKYKISLFPKFFLGMYNLSIVSPIITLINKRINHYFEFSSLIDDKEIIKKVDGQKFLNENPQDETPGAFKYPKVNGYSVSTRWLRYIYFLSQIHNYTLLSNSSTWIDVGSYYGGLQGLVKKYFPDIKIIMVDFEHQLARSYVYLKTLFPDSNHILPNQARNIKNFNDVQSDTIIYVDQKDFHLFSNNKVDLFTNFFSLGEMKKNTFESYLNSSTYKNSRYVYMANRFSSSPYFDKTYDDNINIFNYRDDRKILHFDVLPINHYQISNRELFKRSFFRNNSSPYFELILKQNNEV